MNKWITISVATFFLVLSGCCIWTTILVMQGLRHLHQETNAFLKTIDQRTADILKTVQATETLSDTRIASIQADLNRQLTSFRQDLNGEILPVTTSAKTTLDTMTGTIGQISAQSQKLGQMADGFAKVVADSDKLVTGATPEVTGLLRDSRLTAAEFGRTAIYIRQQTPPILKNLADIEADVKKSTDSAAVASAATAQTMKNLQKATNPLPGWIRIPLSVTGAMAPTASGVVTSLAATGVFQK